MDKKTVKANLAEAVKQLRSKGVSKDEIMSTVGLAMYESDSKGG